MPFYRQPQESTPLGEKKENDSGSCFLKVDGSKHCESHFNSLYNKAKEYSANKDQMRIQEEIKELQECYFSPKINRKSSQEAVRSLDNFLEDQNKYESMKKNKQTQLKEQVQNEQIRELTLIPKINLNKSPSGRDSTIPIHERLFSLTKETSHPQNSVSQVGTAVSSFKVDDSTLFSPSINLKSKSLKRKDHISVILYNDAQRRTEKSKGRDASNSTHIIRSGRTESGSSFIATSERSEQVYSESFIKHFQQAWVSSYPTSGENSNSHANNKIDYLRMNNVLENLLFVTQNTQVASNQPKITNPNIAKERSLVYDLWGNLKGDRYRGVSKRNLCLFLLVLYGIRNTGPALDLLLSFDSAASYDSMDSSRRANTHSEEDRSVMRAENGQRMFGFFEGENWYVGEDMQAIQSKYDLLVKNRLNQQKIRNLNPRAQEQEEKKQRKQKEICSQKVITIDLKRAPSPNQHVAILVQQKNMQVKKHQAIKQAEAEKEVEICTFQPNIERCAGRISDPGVGVQKSLTLYKMMFKPQSQKRDKATFDVEYEKQCDECTFSPDLSVARKFQQSSSYINRDVEKSIERMKSARQFSMNTSLMFSRGYHNLPNYQTQTFSSNCSEKKNFKNHSFASSSSKALNPFKTFDEYTVNDSKQFIAKTMANDYTPHSQSQHMHHNDNQATVQPLEWNSSENWQTSGLGQASDFQQEAQKHEFDVVEQLVGAKQLQPTESLSSSQKTPLLFVDVNIGKDKQERITIFHGDKAEDLSRDFAAVHKLDEKIRKKLEGMLESQMKEYLHRSEAVSPKN